MKQDAKTEVGTKKLTIEDLKNVRGGRRKIKSGGRGSINGKPCEFPVDEF